jgi:hypothetical protein
MVVGCETSAIHVTFPLKGEIGPVDRVEKAALKTSPAENVRRSGEYVDITVYYGAKGVYWESVGETTPAAARIDAGQSTLTVSMATDESPVPSAVGMVQSAICERFQCSRSAEAPLYAFDLEVDGASVFDRLDRDRIHRSSRGTSEAPVEVAYQLEDRRYRINSDDALLLPRGVDDPRGAVETFLDHLTAQGASQSADRVFDIHATHVIFALRGPPDIRQFADKFGEPIPVTEASFVEDGFQAMTEAVVGADGSVMMFLNEPGPKTVEVHVRLRPKKNTIGLSSPKASWDVLMRVLEHIRQYTGVEIHRSARVMYQIVSQGESLSGLFGELPSERIVSHDGPKIEYEYGELMYQISHDGMVRPMTEEFDEVRPAIERLLEHLGDVAGRGADDPR